MAVHFCPALTVISRTTSRTNRSSSGVPAVASGPRIEELSESVSEVKRTEFVALDINLFAESVRKSAVPYAEQQQVQLVLDLPALPMTRARVLRKGDDLTCVAAGGMVRRALAAAERVAADKVSVEVIDLRCVMPLDESTIITSAARTGRVLVLDEAPRGGGLAAEVLALVAETATARAARVLLRRLTGAPTPIGYAPHLAAAAVPDARAIVTVPSSIGWRITSIAPRANSGNSSRNSTP